MKKMVVILLCTVLLVTSLNYVTASDNVEDSIYGAIVESTTGSAIDAGIESTEKNILSDEIKYNNGKAYSSTKLIVKLKDKTADDKVKITAKSKTKIKSLKKNKELSSIDAELWEISKDDNIDDVIKTLNEDPDVEYAEPNYLVVASGTTIESYSLESAHPYSNNYNYTWNVTKPNATRIRVHFSYIDTESGYDYVKTSAGDSYNGSYSSGVWSSFANGSTINITLTSDSSVTKNGFKIDQIEYEVATSGTGTTIESYSLESAHPYSNNYNYTWNVTKPNATRIRVHFSYIDTESGYDYVKTSAGDNYNGSYSSGVWSSFANGSTISITLTSDSSMTKNGFVVDQIEYETTGQSQSPNDTRFTDLWGLKNSGQTVNGSAGTNGIDINFLSSWNTYDGSGVIVGVIDTGIYISHEDLQQNIYVNSAEIPNNNIDDDHNGKIDDYNGWDFINNDKTVYDTDVGNGNDDVTGHGTHVAGIIAALGNNSKGVIGVAPKAKILPLKAVGDSWGIGVYVDGVINAISYANSKGVKVINCSFSVYGESITLKAAMQNTPNILYICSAGNNGRDITSSPNYPASYGLSNQICVASINSNCNLDSSSNYGSPISIAAPGVDILSTISNNSYGFKSGTSMAAPYVTGLAAKLYSKYPGYSVSSIKSLILSYTKTLSNLNGKVSTSGIPDVGNSMAH